jgi:tRNA pseudouridine38-40 synthase
VVPHLIRLLLEYDGSAFMGWQRQAGLATVQGALEAALGAVTGEPVEALDVRCAGRTDAGVHALGQVVTFHTQSPKEPRRFAPALNHFLPDSIRVQRAEAAPKGFSARHHSSGKTYRYCVYRGPHPSALLLHRAWHVRRRLSMEAMQQAASALTGSHDFESFRSAHCDAPHARRVLHAITVAQHEPWGLGEILTITLRGDAFCRHMCRIIAGTLVEVGAGLRAPGHMAQILAARSRSRAGETAPGYGLTLMHVAYPQAWAFGP